MSDELVSKEMELVNNVDTLPDAGGLVVRSKEEIQDILYFADNIDLIIAAHAKIRMAILKLTMPGDWVIFNKKAELGFAPVNRIGATVGVSFNNWSAEKITGSDENGSWYRWEYQCDAVHGKRSVRVYGRAGTRDKFLGFENDKWKDLSEINEGNIKIWAMRACKKEGVKDLFGLHGMDPEYLKKFGIDLSVAGGYQFKSPEQKNSAANAATDPTKISDPQRKRLWAMSQGKKSQDEIKAYLKHTYGIDSTNDIKRDDYEDVCNWVEGKAIAGA